MSIIRKNLLKRLPIILMVMLLALAIAPAMVYAQAPPTEDPTLAGDDDMSNDEESTFKSPNDVKNLEQKTANILDAVAQEVEDLDQRREALEAIDDTDDRYDEAQEELRELDKRVADLTDLLEEDMEESTISQLRKEGLGYGQICHALGIHPSALGNKYGHLNAHHNEHAYGKKGDMSAATARDLKTGWARGHGKSVSGKNNGKGKADSFGIDNNGKAKGKSNGKGGGKGNGKDK